MDHLSSDRINRGTSSSSRCIVDITVIIVVCGLLYVTPYNRGYVALTSSHVIIWHLVTILGRVHMTSLRIVACWSRLLLKLLLAVVWL